MVVIPIFAIAIAMTCGIAITFVIAIAVCERALTYNLNTSISRLQGRSQSKERGNMKLSPFGNAV